MMFSLIGDRIGSSGKLLLAVVALRTMFWSPWELMKNESATANRSIKTSKSFNMFNENLKISADELSGDG